MIASVPPRPAPLVSIVIPAFNHGRYVAEAIDSVLSQDYGAVDITVIDDGSTDDTPEVLARYRDRVRVIHQRNAGQAATINRGWREAEGDILSYLSADDRLRQHAVSTAVNALQRESNVVMVYGDYALIDPQSATVRHVRTPDFDYEEMVCKLVCAPGPGVFIRRAAAEQAGEWNAMFRRGPDFEYWLRLGLVGPFRRIPDALAELRVHEGSTSFSSADHAGAEEPVRIMESYFVREDLPPRLRGAAREAVSSAHLLAARAHLRSHRIGASLRSLRQAAELYPRNLLSARAARLLVNALLNRPAHIVMWSLRRNGRSGSAVGASHR